MAQMIMLRKQVWKPVSLERKLGVLKWGQTPQHTVVVILEKAHDEILEIILRKSKANIKVKLGGNSSRMHVLWEFSSSSLHLLL
jgi:hypothetical protein